MNFEIHISEFQINVDFSGVQPYPTVDVRACRRQNSKLAPRSATWRSPPAGVSPKRRPNNVYISIYKERPRRCHRNLIPDFDPPCRDCRQWTGERLQYRSPILPSSAVPHDKHSDLCILHARAGMLDSSKDSGKKADGARWNLCNCLYIVFHAICV